jgi:hypothetical protein
MSIRHVTLPDLMGNICPAAPALISGFRRADFSSQCKKCAAISTLLLVLPFSFVHAANLIPYFTDLSLNPTQKESVMISTEKGRNRETKCPLNTNLVSREKQSLSKVNPVASS